MESLTLPLMKWLSIFLIGLSIFYFFMAIINFEQLKKIHSTLTRGEEGKLPLTKKNVFWFAPTCITAFFALFLFSSHQLAKNETTISTRNSSPTQVSCQDGDMARCVAEGHEESKKGNIEEARRLLSKACDGNEMWGCNQLAEIEAKSGKGLEAFKLFNKACDGGLGYSCKVLGNLTRSNGKSEAAQAFFYKACESKEPSGCHSLAEILIAEGDVSGAKSWLQKGCDANLKESCELLASLYNQ